MTRSTILLTSLWAIPSAIIFIFLGVWFVSPATIIQLLPWMQVPPAGDAGRWGAGTETENTSIIHLAIGAHHYAIQRNYIEYYDRQKSVQNLVMIPVYIPGFMPITNAIIAPFKEPREITGHIVSIGLTQQYNGWKSQAENILLREKEQGLKLENEPASYDLIQLHHVMGMPDTGTLEFFGDTNTGKLYLRCDNFNPSEGLHSFCEGEFSFADLAVSIRFSQTHLSEWKSIYQHTVQLLNSFKED